jgi:ABC-type phosphate transport system substrate-binding protein
MGNFPESRETIVIIVHAQNPISSLTIGEVRSYWMRRPKKRWELLNKSIKPVDLKNKCEAKSTFYSHLIKMSEEAVESYFLTRQYQAGEIPPVKLGNDAEVIEYVSNEPGAIGYILSSSVTSKDQGKIKVVLSM